MINPVTSGLVKGNTIEKKIEIGYEAYAHNGFDF
jgi:hypothetical protein